MSNALQRIQVTSDRQSQSLTPPLGTMATLSRVVAAPAPVTNSVPKLIKVLSMLDFAPLIDLASLAEDGPRAASSLRASLASLGRSHDGQLPPNPRANPRRKSHQHLRTAAIRRIRTRASQRARITATVLLMESIAACHPVSRLVLWLPARQFLHLQPLLLLLLPE
jgi:hypothetical protein